MRPTDREVITVDGTVRSIDALKLTSDVGAVVVRFAAGPIRTLVHGDDPDTNTGDVRFDGDEDVMNLLEARGLRMIRDDVTNGTVVATIYKEVTQG